jgi:tetratricopeptide (TPR) repeat protein
MDVQSRGRWLLAKLSRLVLVFTFVCLAASATNQTPQGEQLDQEVQSVFAAYKAKRYDQALAQIKPLFARFPDTFEVNELMGLIYAAEGEDESAIPFLKSAVRIRPQSVPARTSLALSLVRVGQNSLAEVEFKKATELEPSSFDTNHKLGEFYIHIGKLNAAIPYLEAAQKNDPSSYVNGYDLATAYLETKNFEKAKQQIRALIPQQDTAELHSLLGEVDEKSGNPVESVNEYQRAAHMDPSDTNMFEWGSELLLHLALEPATQVFTLGTERYPQSARMQIGLGISLYARGTYDKAVSAFLRACDLAPNDPRPFLFLAKAYNISTAESREVSEHLERYVQIEPRNAQAHYYYAMSIWKGTRGETEQADLTRVESQLKTAAALDPSFPHAHVQLGNLYASEKNFPAAIGEYNQAISLQPESPEAHYRLAHVCVQTAEKECAAKELAIFERLSKQRGAESERQRNEIRQFVYSMNEQPPGPSAQDNRH